MSLLKKHHIVLTIAITICSTSALFGQYYFGRNKIQYNRFQWQILKTKHFDIYFYPEMEELAEIGAYLAEESYRHLQDKFNHNILQRIPLVFYSSHFHFEETNTLPYIIPPGVAGFFEYIKGRVVVPSDGSLSQFRKVIRHELVHVFQRSYVSRTLKDHRILRFKDAPLWFTEGLAEYWSEGWTTEAEMIIRDGVLHNTIVPIESMGWIWGTYIMYKEGQSILKFISDTYGEEKILQLLQNIWKEETFSKVMKITIGKDYKELSEEWLYYLKKSRFPMMEEKEFPRMVTTRLTEKGFNSLPSYYRDGDVPMVVFVANRDGYSSIYRKPVVKFKEKRPEILIKGERTPELESFHLQNSRIDVDSAGRLAFIAKSGPQDILNIFDIASKRIVQTYAFDDLVSLFSPSWSPDGTKLALSGLDKHGRSDLYVISVKDGSIRRLTVDFYEDQDPDWSPDGRCLVFSSDRTDLGDEGYANLFIYDLQASRIRYLTFGPYHDKSPAWSPDGRYIAFSSDRDGVYNIWLIGQGKVENHELAYSLYRSHSNGDVPATLRQVTHYTGGGYYPCWTDKNTLLLSVFENLSFQVSELYDLEERWQEAPEVEPDPLVKDSGLWIYPRISGRLVSSKVRYRKKFSLDIAQSQVVQDPIYGTAGGGQLVISDMLGDEQYYFLIFNNARSRSEFWKSFNLAATRVDLSRRVNYALGLYRLAGRYYNRYEGYFYENRYGGYASVSYPFNTFERLETSINIRHSTKDRYTGSSARKAFLLSNFISYAKDNSLWGPTGPLDGVRYNITLGNTVDVRHSNVSFTTVMFDLRKYFRIGYRMCHAIRVWGQFNHGKEPLPFFMGGSWDLRGYKLWSLWGTKLALISNEFRFPFIDQFYLGFPFGGIGFNSIRGALFVDAGNVWEDKFGEIKGSLGFGLRLRIGGYLVLRLDIGKKTNFKTIYPTTFTQFFFGWDF